MFFPCFTGWLHRFINWLFADINPIFASQVQVVLMPLIKRPVIFVLLIMLVCGSLKVSAQCGTPISTFPYAEDFESNNGNWVTGGTASDWAWGTPVKTVINNAASGSKCWVTGGLTASSYNNGENSWLQSPCFDFTGMLHPQISFSVFWETEKKFDGASFQYSTNGTTWTDLGSVSDGPCIASNWFNNASINFLGSAGWSGNIQSTSGSCQGGSGSGTWVIAKHDLIMLAGTPTVSFRFRFGAGTTCNNFDGFAVDAVTISEVVSAPENFTYTCQANGSFAFSSTTPTCASSYAWDFGDPASGVNNNSSVANPVHAFSSPGVYPVSLTITYASGPPVVVNKMIEVLGLTVNVLNPIKCFGDNNGALTVVASGGTPPYNYVWNTTPLQSTASVNNLVAGDYTISVSTNNSCIVSTTVSLPQPALLDANAQTTAATCTLSNGTATASVNGGVNPYTLLWSGGQSTAVINGLAPGAYSLKVTDANGCNKTISNIVVQKINNTVAVSLGKDTVICPGQFFVLNPGIFAGYQWQDNSSSPTFTVFGQGTYFVKVTDANGCSGSDTINVTADCSDIYFPTAFTPDNNNLNDAFGPVGNLGAVKQYSFNIYNRYGQLLFSSTDPYKKWDGRISGKLFNTGSFVWLASYNINGGPQKTAKGMVTLVH